MRGSISQPACGATPTVRAPTCSSFSQLEASVVRAAGEDQDIDRPGPPLLLGGTLPPSTVRVFRAESLDLSSPNPTPIQVDGELLGRLPAAFSLERSRLRVIVP